MANRNPEEFYKALFDLESKVAVVIGGTGVLCGQMAWGLLQAGSRIVLVGRNKLKRTKEGCAIRKEDANLLAKLGEDMGVPFPI